MEEPNTGIIKVHYSDGSVIQIPTVAFLTDILSIDLFGPVNFGPAKKLKSFLLCASLRDESKTCLSSFLQHLVLKVVHGIMIQIFQQFSFHHSCVKGN